MIVPTDTSFGLTTDKGYTLGAFGQFLLCQGQTQVDALGYSALPINLVEDGYAQLQRIPGASVPTPTSAFIQGCDNPTFSSDGTSTLANTDPMPPACDQQGPTQCTTPTTQVPVGAVGGFGFAGLVALVLAWQVYRARRVHRARRAGRGPARWART